MKQRYGVLASVALVIAAAVGYLGATGKFGPENPASAQPKGADKQPAPPPSVDGSVLPFPPTPSASTAGLTMQDSVYKKRVEPKRLADGAPNVLVILIDDVGPGVPSTYGGEVNTPTLSRVAKRGVSYNRFHSTAMCSPSRAAVLTGRNHTRVSTGRFANSPTTGTGSAARSPSRQRPSPRC